MRLLERPYPLASAAATGCFFALGVARRRCSSPSRSTGACRSRGPAFPTAFAASSLRSPTSGSPTGSSIPSAVLFVVSALLALAMRQQAKAQPGAWSRWPSSTPSSFSASAIPGLVANIIKRIVGRGRPEVFDSTGTFSFEHFLNDWTYQSFVSGHTATIFAVAFVVSFLSPRWFWPAMAVAVAGRSLARHRRRPLSDRRHRRRDRRHARRLRRAQPLRLARGSSSSTGRTARSRSGRLRRYRGSSRSGIVPDVSRAVALEARLHVGLEVVDVLEPDMDAEQVALRRSTRPRCGCARDGPAGRGSRSRPTNSPCRRARSC